MPAGRGYPRLTRGAVRYAEVVDTREDAGMMAERQHEQRQQRAAVLAARLETRQRVPSHKQNFALCQTI
jgi:hypothetical protein